jgi:hypothetical protein
MRRLVLLLFLIVLAVAGWRFRDTLLHVVQDLRGDADASAVATPELAAAADRKLERLASGEVGIVALSGLELQSLLEYRYVQLLPAFVESPEITIARGRLRVTGRVPTGQLPELRGVPSLASFLPDTTELTVAGQLFPLDDGRVGLGVEEVSTGRIPLPRRFVPELLKQIGRVDEPGLPDDALALPLPEAVSTAYVRGDSLYLRGRPRTGND